MSVSKIGQKFRAAGLYNVSSPVPYRSLYPTLLQDLFDCLNSTPLPTPPFDESSIALLSEGIDAMQIYACIFGNVTGHPPTFHDMLLKRLPSVWKWISFQNPLNGNMIDDVRAGDTLNGACQLQDGQLAMPLVHRMMGIVMFLGPLLASPRSVRALADIPSIVDDLLGILVADSQPSVYSMQHRYFFVFHQLLYDADPAVSRRFREGMESFDERYPGQLVWILSGRLLWFFDRRHEAHDDASFAVVYSKVLTPEFLNNRRTVANLRASALSPVVHACSCITKAMTSFPTFDSSGTNSWVSGPPHKHLAIALWLRLLAALLLTQDPYARAAHSDVILAVRCGLLWVVQSILSASMSLVPQAARTHAGSYQADLARIVMYAMGPAMVWPDCLRVLKECVSRALPLDAASAHTVGHPLWSALSTRYEDLRRAKADYRNDVQNRYICGHCTREATSEDSFKICVCGTASYCSRSCQRAAWKYIHRDNCWPGRLRICRQEGTEVFRDAPDCLTHAERIYLRSCLFELMAVYGDPDALRAVRSVVVDLTNLTKKAPRILYGALDASMEDDEGDAQNIYHWIKVSRGGVKYLLEVNVMPRDSVYLCTGRRPV